MCAIALFSELQIYQVSKFVPLYAIVTLLCSKYNIVRRKSGHFKVDKAAHYPYLFDILASATYTHQMINERGTKNREQLFVLSVFSYLLG
jgi:hypothetical protein